jgi:hypothetical protein
VTKVAICAQHGGFNLSAEAVAHLALAGSPIISVTPWDEYFGEPYDAESAARHVGVIGPSGFSHHHFVQHVLWKDGKVYRLDRENEPDVRSHPDLLRLIEEKGPRFVEGRHCTLEVIEVPDDVKWHIEEYDGMEWVAEDHRTWR